LQVTSVSPTGKKEPDGRSHVTVLGGASGGQVATGVLKVTLAPHDELAVPATSASSTMSSGCANAQAASLTSTLKVHAAVLPDGSLAVQVTEVMPTGKLEPESGLQSTLTWPLLSEAEVLKLTLAEPEPAGLSLTTMSCGQEMAGASSSVTVTTKLEV
jgi:hypothetical protein